MFKSGIKFLTSFKKVLKMELFRPTLYTNFITPVLTLSSRVIFFQGKLKETGCPKLILEATKITIYTNLP